MTFIPNWRLAWRWWSVHVSAIGAMITALPILAPDSLLSLWNAIPGELRPLIPPHLGRAIVFALFVATIVARILKQREQRDGR